MTARQLLLALRARWRTLAGVLALCLAAGAAMLVLIKPQYTAEATVMLDTRSTDPIGGDTLQPLGISNYIATQGELMSSTRVLQRAIRAVHLDTNAELDAAWRHDTHGKGDKVSWIGERILKLKRLVVTPSRESSMITVTYTDVDAQRTKDFLGALTDGYIATTIDLSTEAAVRNNAFFEHQLQQLRTNLSQAQTRLSDFQRDAGVLANDERLDVENAQLTELSNQLVSLRMAEADSSNRRHAAGDQIDTTPEAMSNSIISSMTADLGRQEAHINELAARLGEQNPEMQQARANIAALKQRIELETARIGKSLSVSQAVHASNVAQLQRAYDEQRERLVRIKAMRDQATVLQRDVDNANQAFTDAAARARQTGMESRAALTNASIVEAPSLPVTPSRPRPLLTMILATAAGLLLGVAAALLRELLDRRLRNEDDVALLLGQPLLVQLPFRPAPPAAPRPRLDLRSAPATPR